MTRPDQTALPINKPRTPPYKIAGLVLLLVAAIVCGLVWVQFRGGFANPERLTMIAARSGLSMDPGSKVTYNGVEIGRVTEVEAVDVGGTPSAKVLLDVNKQFVNLIPRNVDAEIKASTVFGNKYIAFSTPKNPSPERMSSSTPIQASAVTTEFNTLFETIVSITQQVDPIKLNQTLTATAQALDGLGERFGKSIEDGNQILADVNPQLPQLQRDFQLLTGFNDVYAEAASPLFDGLENFVVTARTLNEQQDDVDQALMGAVGFGNTGGEVFEKGGPYLTRAVKDLLPTTALLDEYSPALFCTIRNFHDVEPKARAAFGGGNGYSLNTRTSIIGAANPYVFPDNLPRVNASGGPEGRPGCWQPITRDLWPAPYLVMDTGASIAPYNHFELGQPIAIEYVWGRQIGENTINP
ncbi:MCE family protein [Mycolicibacterium sediminis]|uniref:Virulence factor Mce family protein n=1 Tax=Mycolicibacterium sediminis TaxID=1286180 RepID=A0A7I7QM21_9MYCO|nr:MCE family protein [Mycolicibacterium sediminis]BBY27351.1 virulence factor Mce family protein [Mycolicibacterium sediminis]